MTTNNTVNTSLSGQTGTGTFVGSTSPVLVTPTLGAATATSINFGGSSLSTYIENAPFTPTIDFATHGDLSVSYAAQNGFYSQVGKLVTYTFAVVFTPTYTTASGVFRISLPVNSSSTAGIIAFGTVFINSITFPAGTTSPFIYVPNNVGYLEIQCNGSAVPTGTFSTTQITTGTSNVNIYGTVTYFV